MKVVKSKVTDGSSASKMRDLTPRKRKQARAVFPFGMEDCLDKVAAATASVSVQLVQNSQRIDAIEAMSNKVQQDIRDMRVQNDEDGKFMHQRIDSVQRELTDRIENVQHELTHKIDQDHKDLRDHFDVGIRTVAVARSVDGKRIRSLELWRMTIIGAGGVLSFLLIDVIVRFFGTPLAEFFAKFFFNVVKP